MDYITIVEPERWDQGTWASRISPEDLARLTEQQRKQLAVDPDICGTYGCAAGNVIALEFGEKAIDWGDRYEFFISSESLVENETVADGFAGWSIEEAAADILDLDGDEADSFFSGGNTLWDLWDMAEQFSGGRVQRPSEAVIAEAERRMRRGKETRIQIVDMVSTIRG
jgi:hypothetical protein